MTRIANIVDGKSRLGSTRTSNRAGVVFWPRLAPRSNDITATHGPVNLLQAILRHIE